MTSAMDATPPALLRQQTVASLKPSRTAQEFRWKFLKGQQMHATRMHEPAPEKDDSMQWKEARVAPAPRSGCSCVVIGDDCIVFGGTLTVQKQQEATDAEGRPEKLSRVYFNDLMYLRFGDAAPGMWVHQPKRSGELWPSARSGHAAAAVGGRMFVFGGWFESSSSSRMFFLQDFYVLDPSSVIWSVPRASGCPPSARAYAAAVGLKDSFVLVGGTEGHLPWQFKNDVHVFSLKFDVEPGRTARLSHSAADLATGVWSRCSMGGGPPFPLGRAQHSAAAVSRDAIVVFGGVRNSCGLQEPLNDMWTFNLQHLQWKCITPKTDDMHDPGKNLSGPSHRYASACATASLGCGFVLAHGGTRPTLFDETYISAARPELGDDSEGLEHGSDDLWMWVVCEGGGEWRKLETSVAEAVGGAGRRLEVRRTGHCMFVHRGCVYLYAGFWKDGGSVSTYCNDFVVLNLNSVLSQISAAACDLSETVRMNQNAEAGPESSSTSDVLAIRRLLAAVGATSSIRHILDDGVDDDDINVISNMQPHKVALKYKMTEAQARQFVELCVIEQQKEQQDVKSEKAGEGAGEASGISVEVPAEDQLNIPATTLSLKKSQKLGLKGFLHRQQSVRDSFGNRMQMSSYSTLSQFHAAALHIALVSLFPHTADVDALASDDQVDDMDIDDSDFFFRLKVLTLDEFGAGTDAEVFVILVDSRGRESNEIGLSTEKSELAMQNEKIVASGGLPLHVTIDLFEKGSSDSFMIRPLVQGKFRPSGIASIKVRIESQHLTKLVGLDWGLDSIVLEDLRSGAATYFPADTWLTARKRTVTLYADRNTPPLRTRIAAYSQLMRTVPKKQPDGTWDSISKRRRWNRGSSMSNSSGAIIFGIRCSDLPKLDVTSASDPMVVVTMKTGLSTWQELYRTEVIMDNDQPVFAKRQEIPFVPEGTTWVKFSVYDVDDAEGVLISSQDFCGFATVTLQSLAEMGSLGGECKFPLMSGETAAGSIIIFDVSVKLKPPSVPDAPVCADDIVAWLDEPQDHIDDDAAACVDAAAVLRALGAQSCNEIMATFAIAENPASEQMEDACMLTRPAFELMQSDPVNARDFYSICHRTSKAYKKLRAQVSDGFITSAIDESHQVVLEVNCMICSLRFPPEFDLVCMKYKVQLENFCVLCSYAAKQDLRARLQFQMKIRDELQAAVQFSQEDEDQLRNATGSMDDVQAALLKQLEQLKYLAPQAAIDSLTGETPDSLAILKQAYRTFDIDGDGTITDSEVRTLLQGLGVNVSQESLNDLFARFDKDGNNALDFNEFVMMMRSMKQNFGESQSTGSTARVRVTPLNSVQLTQRLQMRRLKIDGLYASTMAASDSSADFFAAAKSPVAFARAASGRSGIGKCQPASLVQTLMAGGGGSGLPSGVVPLGQEKQAIESLLQKGYFARTLKSAATYIRPWSAVTSKDVQGMSVPMAAKEARRRAQLLSQARKFANLNGSSALTDR